MSQKNARRSSWGSKEVSLCLEEDCRSAGFLSPEQFQSVNDWISFTGVANGRLNDYMRAQRSSVVLILDHASAHTVYGIELQSVTLV